MITTSETRTIIEETLTEYGLDEEVVQEIADKLVEKFDAEGLFEFPDTSIDPDDLSIEDI